jgi:hypothetical protein
MPRLHNRVQIYTYVWKAKEISIPMAPVWPYYLIRVIRNHRYNWIFRIYHGVAVPYLGPLGHVSFWSPLWLLLGDLQDPNRLYSVAIALVVVWVCLDYSVKNSFVVISLWDPN